MRTFVNLLDLNKPLFWRIEHKGSTVHWTEGPRGTRGKKGSKKLATPDAAQKEMEKRIKIRLSKGWIETTVVPPPKVTDVTQLGLEEALVNDPDDTATHMAYGDYLSEQGNPRGELIQIQLALEDHSGPDKERKELEKQEKELLDAHQREWLGKLAPYLIGKEGAPHYALFEGAYTYEFQRGWLHTLTVESLTSEVAKLLAQAPQLRLLRNLVLGEIFSRSSNPQLTGLQHLEKSANLSNLRSLKIGKGENHLVSTLSIEPLKNRFSQLEELGLYIAFLGNLASVFSWEMPCLRRLLVVGPDSFPVENLVANSSLGNLQQLTLHGMNEFEGWSELAPEEYPAPLSVQDFQKITQSKHLKSLTHLTFRRSKAGDEGCEELIQCGLLNQLTHLNLSDGCITDQGAIALGECPELDHLDSLILNNNAIGPRGIRVLNKRKPAMEIVQQHEPGDYSYLLPEDLDEYAYDDEWE